VTGSRPVAWDLVQKPDCFARVSTPSQVHMNVVHGSLFRLGSWVHVIATVALLSVNEGRSAAAEAANPVQASEPTPQALIDAWQANRSGGIAVALITGDKVVYHCVGQFSAKDPRPIMPDTLFELGSVTKAFTAILLADAIERGEVHLDDPVGEPFATSAITYRQLATHTSGLPRMGPGFFARMATIHLPTKRWLACAPPLPPRRPPQNRRHPCIPTLASRCWDRR
jgi:CubicO group peptidase (beta-lactamase class C family)